LTFPLDHVVIAVSDLAAAIADYRTLGFTVVEGGEHPGRGTHNALVVFSDGAYFELIAFQRPDPDFRWWRVLQNAGPGFVDYALLPNEIEADVAAAQRRGVDFETPVPGARSTPQGQHLAWKTARSPGSDLPFFCGDVTPRALRVPEGAARTHANGAVGVSALTVAVRDLRESASRTAGLLGVKPQWTQDVPGLGLDLALFDIGATKLVLAAATGAGGEPIRKHLETRGEGPFAVTLRRTSRQGRVPLDGALTHGARLEFAPV
jgi:catechol 2,3-dioxygenase-like lactoylglutathione lyase family enzyme